ncbi:hypothetical protein TNCV_445731 [Trichonephila clavipes]|nr:hypothetical protein TNCV_445731 [Trichonephila clavipes]
MTYVPTIFTFGKFIDSNWDRNRNLGLSRQVLGLNFEEGINVCKCIVPLRHEDTLNRRQASSPLVRIPKNVSVQTSSYNPASTKVVAFLRKGHEELWTILKKDFVNVSPLKAGT